MLNRGAENLHNVTQIAKLEETLSVSSNAKNDLHAVCSELSRYVCLCVCVCVCVLRHLWSIFGQIYSSIILIKVLISFYKNILLNFFF